MRMIIKAISIILIFVMATMMLSSCSDFLISIIGNSSGTGKPVYKYPTWDLFPEGYTGGYGIQPGAMIEYWWVETYEECVAAVNKLKSHGSTFANDNILTYDDFLFDAKYCFVIIGDGIYGDEIKPGDDPFDRWAENVRIDCFAFFEEVSIDELIFSHVGRYDAYLFSSQSKYDDWKGYISEDTVEIGEWIMDYELHHKKGFYRCYREVFLYEQCIIFIEPRFFVEGGHENELSMTDECIKELISKGKVIELNDKE